MPRAARLAWAAVAAATGLSMGLGLWQIDSRSLWYDEGITWQVAIQRAGTVIDISKPRYGHMLVYWLTEHFLVSWFGDSPFVMRLPSVIGGAVAVPLLYLVVRRIAHSRLAGVYAALIFAVSMPLVFWQQDVKVYALMVPFCVASTLALVIAVQDRKVSWAIAWVPLSLMACYLNPEALLLLPAQALIIVIWPQARAMGRTLGVSLAVMGAVAIPAAIDAVHFARSNSYLVTPPSLTKVQGLGAFLASAEWEVTSLNGEQKALLFITAAVWVLALGVLILDLARWGMTKGNFGLGLALSWLVVPPVLAYAISALGPHVLVDRYLMTSLPAAAAVAAMLLARVEPRAIGVFGLIYLTVFRFGVLAPSYGKSLDDYAGATRTVLANTEAGDCITFDLQSSWTLFDYYVIRDTAGDPDPRVPANAIPYLPMPWFGTPLGELEVESYSESNMAYYQSQPWVMALVATDCKRLWFFENNAIGGTDYSTGALGDVLSSIATAYHLVQTWQPAGITLQLYERRT